MSAEFPSLVIVVGALELFCSGGVVAFGEVHGCDLEVVLCLVGGVCSEEEAVDCVWLVWWTVMGCQPRDR